MRSDQHSWCKKDRVNRPVQLFYHSGTYAQRRCWHRDANQLKVEVADHQVSGLGSSKVQPLRPEYVLMSGKNFRTFVIHSRNQIVGGFGEDRLCPIFLSSIERTFLFTCQTQPLLKRFCKRNIFECFRENRREKVTRTKS